MKINLEIIDSSHIYAPIQIKDLNTKELVPKMVTRRRLTRSAKIVIYLTSKMNINNNRIIYGNNYGELNSTASILNSISNKETINVIKIIYKGAPKRLERVAITSPL